MKNEYKNILIIALMVFFTTLLISCESNSNRASTNNPLNLPEDIEVNGIHEIDIKKTESYLVKNGITDYKIIVPDDQSKNSLLAVSELQKFIKESSEATLMIENDPGIFDSSFKYISVGENSYTETAGIFYDIEQLKFTGTKIQTKGNSIFIGGATSKGTLNAIYEFLFHIVGFEIFNREIYHLNYEKDVNFYEMNIIEVPDFEYNPPSYGSINSTEYQSRLRYDSVDVVFMPVEGNYWHNTFNFLPPEKFSSSHYKWYATDFSQLCFQAQGDEIELELMKLEFLEKLKETIMKYPNSQNVTITAEDNGSWCQCEACLSMKEYYKTDAAVQILFVNDIEERINDWLSKNDVGLPQDKKIGVAFFAYNTTNDAPVVMENGKYVPIDEKVILNDNVFVFYAPIMANYNESFKSESNYSFYENMEKWSAISSEIFLWVYQTNFANYLYPYNSFGAMQENYKIFKKFDVKYIFDQGQWNNGRSTAFGELKYYLTSKLSWNVNEKMEDLISRYFKNVYGPASKTMRELFETIRIHMKYLEEFKAVSGSIYYSIADIDFFPKYMIDQLIDLINQAYEEISFLENTNLSLYEKYREMINIESIFPRAVLLSKYSGFYSEKEFDTLKSEFINDTLALGFTKWSEGIDLLSIINSW